MFKVFLDDPNLGDIEKRYLNKAIDTNFVSIVGPFVPEFEDKFARYIGAKRAVSVQSGTAAIHTALYELGIGGGDEVIVPALTFIATVNPVLYVGATPVIVDVDPLTWTIDFDKIEKVITKKTRAIIPVHLYGSVSNMKKIKEIASEYNLFIIEDATESLGALYDNKATGTIGDIGCFSFNGNKLITTGGGGMIATNDEKRADHIKFLVNQARDASKGYYHPELGFNYRMTNIEASLGLAQLERIDEFLKKKKAFRKIYRDVLKGVPYIKLQEAPDNAIGSWWLTCIKIERDYIDIEALREKLKDREVPTRRVFVPLGQMPYLKEYAKDCPNAYDIYNKGLCLPSSTLNSESDIEKAAHIIREIL